MLRQPNYRFISFDPDAIADRIIDPELVPLVKSFAETVFALDREFMRGAASEFRDEKGRLWQRKMTNQPAPAGDAAQVERDRSREDN